MSEAWQIDRDGFLTEGGSTNARVINGEGQLGSRKTENFNLNGITHRRLIEYVQSQGIKVRERLFIQNEAKFAWEPFLTSTPSFVTVVENDGDIILVIDVLVVELCIF